MDYAYKVTTHGRAAIAACMALEKPPRITRVAFGSGRVGEDINLADVHELLAYVSDGAVAGRRHQDDRFFFTIQYANSEHRDVKMFVLSEFAVFGEDPETGEETDFIYGTLGDYCQPVPAYNPAYPPSVFNFPLELIISDELQVTVSAPAGLVTWEDLERMARAGMLGITRADLTLPAAGWEVDTETGYPLRLDIPREGVTERVTPVLTVLPGGLEAAGLCGLAPFARTLENRLRVYAQKVPEQEIPASLALLGDVGGYFATGGGTEGEAVMRPTKHPGRGEGR